MQKSFIGGHFQAFLPEKPRQCLRLLVVLLFARSALRVHHFTGQSLQAARQKLPEALTLRLAQHHFRVACFLDTALMQENHAV